MFISTLIVFETLFCKYIQHIYKMVYYVSFSTESAFGVGYYYLLLRNPSYLYNESDILLNITIINKTFSTNTTTSTNPNVFVVRFRNFCEVLFRLFLVFKLRLGASIPHGVGRSPKKNLLQICLLHFQQQKISGQINSTQ